MTESKFASAIRLPSVKFPTIGSTVTGEVLEVTDADVPHFDEKTGRIDGVEKDKDGNTIQQLDVVLETAAGRQVLHTGGSIFYAIGRALAVIGADDLIVGDTLTVTYESDGEQAKVGRNAPKQYTAVVSSK